MQYSLAQTSFPAASRVSLGLGAHVHALPIICTYPVGPRSNDAMSLCSHPQLTPTLR